MASIRRISRSRNKEGLHKYRVRFRISGNPNPIQRTLYAKNQSDIEEKANALKNKLSGKTTSNLTWNDAYPIWLEKFGKDLNDTYLEDYSLIIKQFTQNEYTTERSGEIKQGCGIGYNLPITETTIKHISDFMDWRSNHRINELQKQGKTVIKNSGNSAANKARRLLLAYARKLKTEGELPNEQYGFENIQKRSYNSKESKVFDKELFPEYMDALSLEARLAVEWIAFTGWRSTVTCELREEFIDEKNLIAFQIHKGKKERNEPLDETLLNIIYRARQLKSDLQNRFNKKKDCTKSVDHRYVFVNTLGQPWRCKSLRQHCQRQWKKAGLPKKKIHELRTTFGTEAGKYFGMSMVQAALGHDSPQSTEHYLDKTSINIAEVGTKVRESLIINSKQEHELNNDRLVTIICPELKEKCQIPMANALKLFA